MQYNNQEELMNSRPEGLFYIVNNNTRSTTLEERIQIVEYCIKNDKNYALTAKEFNVSYGQVYTWIRKYNADGTESLLDHRGKRKDKETMTELELLQIENRMLKAVKTFLNSCYGSQLILWHIVCRHELNRTILPFVIYLQSQSH